MFEKYLMLFINWNVVSMSPFRKVTLKSLLWVKAYYISSLA